MDLVPVIMNVCPHLHWCITYTTRCIHNSYYLPHTRVTVAAFRLFNEIRDYKKIGGLKKEISRLCQQIFLVNVVCTNQHKVGG